MLVCLRRAQSGATHIKEHRTASKLLVQIQQAVAIEYIYQQGIGSETTELGAVVGLSL